MKKTFKNISAASPLFRGLLFVIPIAVLLLGTVGCAGNNGDTGQVPVNNGNLDQSESMNTPAATGNLDQSESVNTPVGTGNLDQISSADYGNAYIDTADQIDDLEEFNVAEITVGEDGVIEIKDPHFSFHMQEIQLNRSEFLGETIRFEGLFLSTYWEGEAIYFVARLEGGCCGFYGLEVYLNEFSPFEDETWVEVTGILEEFFVEEFETNVLRLDVIEIFEV